MKYSIIAIGRQFASGGRIIGQNIAKNLGMDFYDKEIIALTAKEGGFSEEMVAKMEKKKPSSLEYSFYGYQQELPMSDKIFMTQFKVIQQISDKGNGVIVGRCADYVLRNNPRVLKIFIYAPMEERVWRCRDVYGIECKNYESFIKKEDQKRASYYNYFTHMTWGGFSNYHLMINSTIGIDAATDMVTDLIKTSE